MSRKSDTATLQSLFPTDWDASEPATLVDLAKAEWDSLSERAKALRSLLVAAKHEMEREPILTASMAMALLGKHHLPALPGKWVLVALDKDLQRVYAPHRGGGMRMVRCSDEKFPTPEKLEKDAPLKDGGSYLAIYGGSPDPLLDEEEYARFLDVAVSRKVADVIFWDDRDQSATFWSVKAGTGQRGNQPCEFPHPDAAKKWSNHAGRD